MLLLTPTAANVSDVNARLEDVVRGLSELRAEIERGEASAGEVRQLVSEIRTEMARVKQLLDNVAHFYNCVDGRRQTGLYNSNGCVRPQVSRFRTIVQL